MMLETFESSGSQWILFISDRNTDKDKYFLEILMGIGACNDVLKYFGIKKKNLWVTLKTN